MSIKGNPLTREVVTKQMDRRIRKTPPELQFHVAATLIAHGEPYAITKEDRQDLAGEIAQFCVPIEAKWVGNLKRHHLDQVFENLKQSVLIRLREHNVMAAGE